VLDDYFGANAHTRVTPEVGLSNPRISFDYVAVCDDGDQADAIAIETQAIDLRGGGVGPAFQAWMDGRLEEWRQYFTDEAERKGRKDTVDYGVNMGNIYKRLGLQAAEKGTYLKSIGVRLYVVMQDLPYLYLSNRIRFEECEDDWDITFMTFEYAGAPGPDGQLGFNLRRTVRTKLASYISALAANNRSGTAPRDGFLHQVEIKSRGR
jgi:hypothetical protein